jgi:subtilisin family serine protease
MAIAGINIAGASVSASAAQAGDETLPWNLRQIGMEQAWRQTQGEGATVAVLDLAFVPHDDLDDRMLPGIDVNSGLRAGEADQCPEAPARWRGTRLAGVIAGSGGSDLQAKGVAPLARILPVQIGDACENEVPSSDSVARGIRWAAGLPVAGLEPHGQQTSVIQLSYLDERHCSSEEQLAIREALSRNVVVIAAAGDRQADANLFAPANCQGVMVVGAHARGTAKAGESNGGGRLIALAPGGGPRQAARSAITALRWSERSQHGLVWGTPFAAAHVTGSVALMKSLRPQSRPDQVLAALVETTRDRDAMPGRDFGTGRLDASRAVARLVKVVDEDIVGGAEPNDDIALAPVITRSTVINSWLDRSGKADPRDRFVDFYRVQVPAGREVSLDMLFKRPSKQPPGKTAPDWWMRLIQRESEVDQQVMMSVERVLDDGVPLAVEAPVTTRTGETLKFYNGESRPVELRVRLGASPSSGGVIAYRLKVTFPASAVP